jgi:hypothetical protein
MTLEAWVFPTAAATTWATAIMKEQPGNLVYTLYTGSPSNRPNVYISAGTSTTSQHGFAGPNPLPINTWSHLAGTYDGATLRLYVNGALVGSQAFTGSIVTSTGALRIGGNAVWGEYFQGRLDDIRIYNRALGLAEIQSDMNTPVGNGTPPPPDTTPPAVAVTGPAPGATVSGLVSVAASASDDGGIAGVQFFVDNQPLGAEATDVPYATVWDTAGLQAGSTHVITAVARDLAGNTATSASVSVTIVAANPSVVGQWAAPSTWPLVAVHATLLPSGEILAHDGQTFAGNDARVWNPATNTFVAVRNNNTNIFCSGHCKLADGRVLVAGGHVGTHAGVRDTNIFDPQARTWTLMAPMAHDRWYPTVTTLPDGRVIVVAGEAGCGGCDVEIPEIYDPQTNTWTQLSGAPLPLPYYPHMFVLPDGRLLAASTTEHPIITQVLDLTTQTWSVVDPDPTDGGSAAMFLPGKVVKAGTSYHPDDPVVPSGARTFVLDMTTALPAWQETAPMVYPRTYLTLTLLADGSVLATGGGVTTDAVAASDAVLPAELWSPATQTWSTMASLQVPRLYHSTALLLPDARVLVMGGGRFFGQPHPTDRLSAEIYSPPYLFKGARPVITAAPTTATYGSHLTVQTPDAARIASVALIRLGSVTHSFNMDQRYVPLAFTAGAGTLDVQAPANANLAPPGHYMLFILDGDAVPSVAPIIKIQ